jgi:hypothetical protein
MIWCRRLHGAAFSWSAHVRADRVDILLQQSAVPARRSAGAARKAWILVRQARFPRCAGGAAERAGGLHSLLDGLLLRLQRGRESLPALLNEFSWA